jgi:hypothetical protein
MLAFQNSRRRCRPATAAFCAIAMTGCVQSAALPLAKSAALPLSNNTVQISATGNQKCGRAGIQQVALKRAAYETVHRGYDRFVVVDGGYQNSAHVVGHMPMQVQTYGTATASSYGRTANAYGQTNTTVSGGQPIVGRIHDQDLVVKMFHDSDPAGGNAMSARDTLGPDWKKQMQDGPGKMC